MTHAQTNSIGNNSDFISRRARAREPCVHDRNGGNEFKEEEENRTSGELPSFRFNHLQECVSNKAIIHECFVFFSSYCAIKSNRIHISPRTKIPN